ncbi:hypothetical protein BO94DRAFT_586536 [Aspergillus sclerotioniger CBS 115572]|uniref:GPI anchored protein n=1 Tax=Aspergillus sclerotioniger CBS 115572 TaxID=1450535 RepID=A0A317WDS1_9EURO|nr:hypothetical protein BO94DRAFT_586536 [Aspergillus sclerotioniger CBS 115572]PWY84554.1 hypothetical protein BO94DRAFT_586536 [Aspergillus sclerotioniger CBS 115572]
MLFKVNSLIMVFVAVWLFAVAGYATDVVDEFGVALDEESVMVLAAAHDAFAYAKSDLFPRDVTIIKTVCETETSVASTFTTVPVPTVVTGTTLLSTGTPTGTPTGVATGKSPVASETTTAPTTGPVVTSQHPVTSKTEGTPGTTVKPPSSSGTHSASTTGTEDTTSSVSSGEQTSNHTVSTHTNVSAGTTAPTGTHTPSPSPTKNVAGGNDGMYSALLALAAAHLGFSML